MNYTQFYKQATMNKIASDEQIYKVAQLIKIAAQNEQKAPSTTTQGAPAGNKGQTQGQGQGTQKAKPTSKQSFDAAKKNAQDAARNAAKGAKQVAKDTQKKTKSEWQKLKQQYQPTYNKILNWLNSSDGWTVGGGALGALLGGTFGGNSAVSRLLWMIAGGALGASGGYFARKFYDQYQDGKSARKQQKRRKEYFKRFEEPVASVDRDGHEVILNPGDSVQNAQVYAQRGNPNGL